MEPVDLFCSTTRYRGSSDLNTTVGVLVVVVGLDGSLEVNVDATIFTRQVAHLVQLLAPRRDLRLVPVGLNFRPPARRTLSHRVRLVVYLPRRGIDDGSILVDQSPCLRVHLEGSGPTRRRHPWLIRP